LIFQFIRSTIPAAPACGVYLNSPLPNRTLASVASVLASTSIKEILIGATSSVISYHLRDVCSICRCCWNVVIYKWKIHNGKIEIISKEKKLARSFNFMFRYIDDVLSLNNSRIGNFVDRIYPTGFETKDTTDTERSASYIMNEERTGKCL
jgi:hypothetical protein